MDSHTHGTHPAVESIDDLRTDLAARYKSTTSSGSMVDAHIVEADLAALDRDGYVVLESLISAEVCDDIRSAVEPLLSKTGRNSFEGYSTQRLYGVLNKTRTCDHLVEHPRVLALLDRLLLPNYLLSQLQAISICPGEAAQLLHYDDGMYPLPRPRAALSAATIWAIDAFAADNGATVVIPGSHHWSERHRPAASDHHLNVVMPQGSCILFVGTLWHGGGANNTTHSRLALTAQYCQPWLRSQEAFTLSITAQTATTVSEDLRRMLGYSIYPPFLGMVEGMHPKRLLETNPPTPGGHALACQD